MKVAGVLKAEAKRLIQKGIFHNEWLQAIIWRAYYTPDRRQPSVPLSKKAQKHLNELREHGITLIPGFTEAADHVEKTYFSVLEGEQTPSVQPFEIIDLGPRALATNTTTCRISFKDEGLNTLFLDNDLCSIIYNYYQRQPFYREHPCVIKNAMSNDVGQDRISRLEASAKFHVDFYRQIACMLLVNDITVDDTHLEYALGSHNKRHSWSRYTYSDEQIESEYEILHAVGKRGTLIVMDAGSGLHRGVHKTKTIRKILHFVVTTGHNFPEKLTITSSDIPDLARQPEHVRRMFDRLVK